MTRDVAAKAQHSWVDRVIGRHDWVIQATSRYHFRGGGTAVFEYECRCGALKESVWPGERDMQRDGIGSGLVEKPAHEAHIRRYLDTFQPEMLVAMLDAWLAERRAAALAALDANVEETP